ncbi:MAG TPA: FtsW/RodA/SpoVE family cell cycle protein [Phycisphaeraceae bacterium]
MKEAILAQLRLLMRPHPGWYGLAAAVMLTTLGVMAISTVDGVLNVPTGVALAQGRRWLPIALIAMSAAALPRPRLIGRAAWPLLTFALLLLVYVVIPGAPRVPRINGTTAWIDLGVMNFQPSELGKVAFVLAMAWYLRYRESYRTLTGLLVPFAIMLIPVALILKEPDLGQAMVFAPTLFVMLVAAGARLRHIGSLLGIGLLAVALNVAVIYLDPPHDRRGGAWDYAHVLAPHQERRVAAMIWPDRYAKRDAFQPLVAQRLIGAGGLIGVGKERARTLVRFNRLPEPHNDMIFAVIVNRWGLLGGGAVLGLYLVLLSSFFLVAARSKDPFARLVCVGFGGMIFAQAMINIGVAVGLVPTTGITLPLVSYGGSSLVATFTMIGLMLNFACRRPVLVSRPSFEFDHADPAYS